MSDNNVDLNWFTSNAIRTESPVDTVVASKDALQSTITGMILFGQILDQYKKDIFYGKGVDVKKISDNLNKLQSIITTMRSSIHHTKTAHDVDARVFHGIVGKATESVELLEALELHMFHNQDLDIVNVGEELGDDAWYEAVLTDALGIDWGDTFENVIKKLQARFPNKFTSEDANVRNLSKERDILEGKEPSKGDQPTPAVPRTLGQTR